MKRYRTELDYGQWAAPTVLPGPEHSASIPCASACPHRDRHLPHRSGIGGVGTATPQSALQPCCLAVETHPNSCARAAPLYLIKRRRPEPSPIAVETTRSACLPGMIMPMPSFGCVMNRS